MDRLQERDRVCIALSAKLSDMGLAGIAGYTGVITECLVDGRNNPGYMVMLSASYQGHFLWFIPIGSIERCSE